MKEFIFENFVCRIGQNAKENWHLLDEAKSNNIFFHLSSFPSGYVILEYEGALTPFMLHTAAQTCKNGTKYCNVNNLKVDWCRCDNIKKGDKVGEVYFKSYRKVSSIKL